jgi:phosphoribosylanthranilate isomerase
LHGDDSSVFAAIIQEFIPVIKVFRIDESFDPKVLIHFEFCSYLLFDTSTKSFGGSGLKFNWEMLDDFNIKTPFLLSGGIGPEDTEAILKLNHPYFRGVDINSKFEIEPGLKNVSHIQEFIKAIKI